MKLASLGVLREEALHHLGRTGVRLGRKVGSGLISLIQGINPYLRLAFPELRPPGTADNPYNPDQELPGLSKVAQVAAYVLVCTSEALWRATGTRHRRKL